MNLEVAEIIRSRIRADKIIPDLWDLGYKFYIIRIVRLQATCFMSWVFFMQAIESYRFEANTRANGMAGGQGRLAWALARLGLLFLLLITPWLDICTPFAYFVYFFMFSHIFMFIDFNNFFLNIKKSWKIFSFFLHFF